MSAIQRSSCLILLIMNGLVSQLNAQDNHYAWMQFGSRNSILYNAGISRFEDQSAVIMNPATLSQATSSSFNFNTNAVGFNTIRFKNGLGQGFDLNNSNLNILPSMASGVLKPKKHDKDWVLGYALYHSNTDKLKFTDRTEQRLDLISEAESPGAENYLAQYQLSTNLDEVSIVAGVGWNISKKLALGLSQTFTYRKNEYIDRFTANVIPDRNAGATVDLVGVSYNIFLEYYKILTHTKLGLTGTAGKWNFGATLSTPALGLMGKGDISADLSLTNIRISANPSVPRRDFLANGRFEKLKSTFKLPWALALGASRPFNNVTLYGALNFYSAVKRYTILNPGNAPFVQPPTSENVLVTPNFLSVWDARRMVWNGSIAADWILRPDYHLLFSFRSDKYYSAITMEDKGIQLPKKNWDNHHFTIGTQRNFKSSEWVIGLRFNFASRDDYPQPYSFEDPTETNFFQGERGTGTISSRGVQLLLSYTFKFGQ